MRGLVAGAPRGTLAVAALLPGVALGATRKSSSRKSTVRSSNSGPVVTWWGPRLGMSSNPDQFVLGAQLDFREVAPGMAISPNVEVGFGDDVTWTAVNADLKHHFAVQGSAWRPYLGGGLSVNFWSWNAPAGFSGTASGSEVGANLVLGAAVPTRTGSRFFTEARVGIGDIPALKVLETPPG